MELGVLNIRGSAASFFKVIFLFSVAVPILKQGIPNALAGEADTLDSIVITGSAFDAADAVVTSPVVVYDSDYIDSVGTASLGQLLRELPYVAGNGTTPAVNGTGVGSYQISLRGLGAQRTLVLVNGKRVVAGDSELVVDLNTIPMELVDRIEVLKDGASTLYGSDAIAGVVNIILQDSIETTTLSGRVGRSSEDDAKTIGLSLSSGKTWAESSLTFHFDHNSEGYIYTRDRAWASRPYRLAAGQVVESGSSAGPWGRYDGQTLGPDYLGDGAGGLRPYDGSTDSYNYSELTLLRQPVEKNAIHLSGYAPFYALSGGQFFAETELYASLDHSSRESIAVFAPTPLAPLVFYGYSAAPYAATNAYNPTGADILDWRRRMIEDKDGRSVAQDVDTSQLNIALQGDLLSGAKWEASINHGLTDRNEKYTGLYDLTKVSHAVGATVTDASNTLRCDTNGDGVFSAADEQDCIPLNVFGENSVTQEMIDYISFPARKHLEARQSGMQLTLRQPDLKRIRHGSLGLAAGVSSSRFAGRLVPDAKVTELALEGAVTGAPSLPTGGSYRVNELFVELKAPVSERIELSLGDRLSHYSTSGTSNNWKLGVNVQPNENLTLQASASTSFRAPSIDNLYGGNQQTFPYAIDPCAENPTPQCIADGVPLAGYTPISDQVRTTVGGNPDLKPETADTFSAGIAYKATTLGGLSLSADYYRIQLDSPITIVSTDLILKLCAEQGFYCDRIDRLTEGANIGAPNLVDDRTINAGSIATSGIDLSVKTEKHALRGGELQFDWQGSYLLEYDKTDASGDMTEYAGFSRFSGDGNFAKWRWTARSSYSHGPFDLALSYRYINSVREFIGASCVSEEGEVTAPEAGYGLSCVDDSSPYADKQRGNYTRLIKSIGYIDVDLAFALSQQSKLIFGIDNLADKAPSRTFAAQNENTDAATYDVLGRYFYLKFEATL